MINKYALLITLLPFAANAQQICFPTVQDALKQAEEQYKEKQFFSALSVRGNVLTITLNPETETYTVFATGPSGRTCVADVGESGKIKPIGQDVRLDIK